MHFVLDYMGIVKYHRFMENKTTTWNIRVTHPSPSMSQDRMVFVADNYQAAKKIAETAFYQFRRTVTLGSREFGMENWYHIAQDGKTIDKNVVGSPVTGQVSVEVSEEV